MLLCLLLLPYMQQRFQLLFDGKFDGYYPFSKDLEFSPATWFDGTYATGINAYYNDHIGFFPYLVQLNSQIDYSLFQKLDYGGTTLGDNNYLFYSDYVDAYYGRDFVGYQLPLERMTKLKRLQDTLEQMGKTMVLVYAPCKAWYCAEYIPALFRGAKGANNYLTAKRIGDSLGIHQIDFNAWFLQLKQTTKEPLYSRQGIHWTNYGSLLGADSLVRYIEQARHIRMAHPRWDEVVHTTVPRVPDNDMSAILNLLFPVTKDTFCYPVVHCSGDSGTAKPRCIYIGDSNFINFIHMGVPQAVNSDWQFWFYFNSILNNGHQSDDGSSAKVSDTDWKKEVQQTDCIVLMYTPATCTGMGNGFIEALYASYFPGK